MVFRVEKTKNYTVMSNYHLREKEMSLKAKGLLSWMLSNVDDWDYSISGIVSNCKENETAICSALKELQRFRYLKIVKLMPETGVRERFEYEYIIYEKPYDSDSQDIENQGLENLELENLAIENLDIENPRQINTDIRNTKERNTNIINTKKEHRSVLHNSKSVKVEEDILDNTNNKLLGTNIVRSTRVEKTYMKIEKIVLTAGLSDRLTDEILRFVNIRLDAGDKMAPESIELQVGQLSDMTEQEAIQSIQTSIKNNWKAMVYDKKETANNRSYMINKPQQKCEQTEGGVTF